MAKTNAASSSLAWWHMAHIAQLIMPVAIKSERETCPRTHRTCSSCPPPSHFPADTARNCQRRPLTQPHYIRHSPSAIRLTLHFNQLPSPRREGNQQARNSWLAAPFAFVFTFLIFCRQGNLIGQIGVSRRRSR